MHSLSSKIREKLRYTQKARISMGISLSMEKFITKVKYTVFTNLLKDNWSSREKFKNMALFKDYGASPKMMSAKETSRSKG